MYSYVDDVDIGLLLYSAAGSQPFKSSSTAEDMLVVGARFAHHIPFIMCERNQGIYLELRRLPFNFLGHTRRRFDPIRCQGIFKISLHAFIAVR